MSECKVLLTGATGFVGSSLLYRISADARFAAVAAVRRLSVSLGVERHVEVFAVGDLAATTNWAAALVDVDVVIHAAARAHIMSDEAIDSLVEYRKVNVDGTMALAHQAATAGVKRFIYISSIKVNGEQTELGSKFKADATLAPEDAYGISKLEAENALLQLSTETGMELVIIRPPLVYGAGVKGNFATMAKLVAKGLPLPLGSIHNKRSLVALDNLVDLIITCIDHPAAANQIFLAGDGEDISTTQLLRGVASAMGKPSRLIPIPASWLMMAATMLGKKAVAQRLLGSLQVDISKAQQLLGWTPPLSVAEGLRRCFPTVKD
jgi:nucleoside-diphosphate-sugar epimerase